MRQISIVNENDDKARFFFGFTAIRSVAALERKESEQRINKEKTRPSFVSETRTNNRLHSPSNL